MYAYCLFCQTQKCALIAAVIERRFGIRCISPEVVQRKWVKGVCEEERHSWLPGYVFLYTDGPIDATIKVPGILRWLGDGELRGADGDFAEMLYECGGVMGTLRLTEVGDRCTIDDPLWRNMEGRVVKMDRGRRRCCVEFTFDGIRRTVWLGYEMVKTSNWRIDCEV